MEAHYEAAHSHSPSPLLIFPFKKWGALNIFAHSWLLSPDGGGWWGAGWHPYQRLRPDVDRITTYNKASTGYKTYPCKGRLIFLTDRVCSESFCHREEGRRHLSFGLLSNMARNNSYFQWCRQALQFPFTPTSGSVQCSFDNNIQMICSLGNKSKLCGMFLPRSTPGLPGTGLNCGGPLGPGVLDSWDMGVPGFIPGVLDFSLWKSSE